MAGHSFGVLCAAHRKIHCSVAVIWVQVEGKHWVCSRTANPFNSIQNCLRSIVISTIVKTSHLFNSPQMLVLPNTLILPIGHRQNQFYIWRLPAYQLLNELLHHQRAVHFLKRFILPSAEFLQQKNAKVELGGKFIFTFLLRQAQKFFVSRNHKGNQ